MGKFFFLACCEIINKVSEDNVYYIYMKFYHGFPCITDNKKWLITAGIRGYYGSTEGAVSTSGPHRFFLLDWVAVIMQVSRFH
jgi:hypothetical protein